MREYNILEHHQDDPDDRTTGDNPRGHSFLIFHKSTKRKTFLIFAVAASAIAFAYTHVAFGDTAMLFLGFPLGFCANGIFAPMGPFLTELFPTHIRSTAVGFCTGSARIITSFGPLVAGLMVGAFGGSFNRVTDFMTCFALLSIVAMLLGRETKGDPLPR